MKGLLQMRHQLQWSKRLSTPDRCHKPNRNTVLFHQAKLRRDGSERRNDSHVFSARRKMFSRKTTNRHCQPCTTEHGTAIVRLRIYELATTLNLPLSRVYRRGNVGKSRTSSSGACCGSHRSIRNQRATSGAIPLSVMSKALISGLAKWLSLRRRLTTQLQVCFRMRCPLAQFPKLVCLLNRSQTSYDACV